MLTILAQPLITVLQAIFLKNQFFRGTPKQSVGIGVLKLLCRWEYLDLQHTELVTMVMERINNTIRDSSMDVTKLETGAFVIHAMLVNSTYIVNWHKQKVDEILIL